MPGFAFTVRPGYRPRQLCPRRLRHTCTVPPDDDAGDADGDRVGAAAREDPDCTGAVGFAAPSTVEDAAREEAA